MQGDIFLKESMYCSWILTIHPHTQNIHFRFQSHSDENDATFSLAGIGNVNDNFCDIKDGFFLTSASVNTWIHCNVSFLSFFLLLFI